MPTGTLKTLVLIADGKYLVVITMPHHKVHEGMFYSISHLFETVAENGNADLLLLSSQNRETHLNVGVSAGGLAYGFAYEKPTVSANGVKEEIIAFNRLNTKVTEALAYYSPTVTDVGTLLKTVLIPAASSRKAGGGAVKSGAEVILLKDELYLFRITSKTSGNIAISIELEFYEI